MVFIVVEDRRTNYLFEAYVMDDDVSEMVLKVKIKLKVVVGEVDYNRKYVKSEDEEIEDCMARGKKSMRAKVSTGDEIVVDLDFFGLVVMIKYFDDDD